MIKRFKNWLRVILKNLLQEEKVYTNTLDVKVHTKNGTIVSQYLITALAGFRLQGMCVSGNGSGIRLISRMDAVDKDHYDYLFDTFYDQVVGKYVWEDTKEPVKPTDLS